MSGGEPAAGSRPGVPRARAAAAAPARSPARPLDPALRRLLDERACERLIVTYAQLVDFGRSSEIADLFVPDGRWEGTDLVLDGQEAIRRWFTAREALARRVSRHVFTNVAVEFKNDDEACATSYMVNWRRDRAEGDEALPVAADLPKYVGECHDTFRRTPDGWRFASRRVEVTFVRPRGGTPR